MADSDIIISLHLVILSNLWFYCWKKFGDKTKNVFRHSPRMLITNGKLMMRNNDLFKAVKMWINNHGQFYFSEDGLIDWGHRRGASTLSIMTLGMTTLNITIKDVRLRLTTFNTECRYGESRCADWRVVIMSIILICRLSLCWVSLRWMLWRHSKDLRFIYFIYYIYFLYLKL